MPVLAKPRHEKFAQAVARGMTAADAYLEAGYSPNRGNAARLNANEDIQRRAEELTRRAAAGVVITRSTS